MIFRVAGEVLVLLEMDKHEVLARQLAYLCIWNNVIVPKYKSYMGLQIL